MPNIDDLSISVKSNVTSATNSIDKLITKLGALSASLGQVNTSGFSAMASGIRQITSATKSDSVKSITELANSIKKFGHQGTNTAIKNIPNVAQSIQLLANTVNGVNTDAVSGITNIAKSISRLGYATADKAITNIPQINTQLQGLIGTVNSLSSSANGISYLSQLSSALTKLGGKTGTTAVNNIPNLTKALNQMIATLSKAPQVSYNVIQLVNSMANLASQGSKVGTASNSLYNGFMRFGAGADYARKKSFSLASVIGKLYASYFLLFRLFGSIGKAIDISSSLTEVENVVNVTFGKYRDLLDDFTETSLQQYGIGELDAKKFASRYQSMGVAMGFTQEEMAKMSVELTKLTGDYASFYDAALGDVHEDVLAIFTGQTRPLRAYGLDLTQATLQEWALSEGMQVNIQDMTQMEKTMLRYQYVMASSEHVIGDFLRTSDSWHNMMTVLNGTLKQFGDTVGNVAINFLKPLVAWFNNAIVVVNEFAVSIMNALGKLFGWEYKYTPGGLTQDDADIVEDYGSALGGAADKAKKLKQQLQGFDELNVLTSNTPSSGAAGGGGSLDDYEYTQTGGLFNVKEVKETYESEIDSLYELGEYISTTISNGLRDIDWQEVYQGAKDFGTGLAEFLNGLISPDLFGATGRTIAGALNTAIYSSLGFGTEFDFDEFGSSIAQGVNEFFDEFDFTAFGQNIVTWVKGLKESLLVAIAEIEWGDILAGIGDILKSLDAETIATLFAFGTISSLFKTGLFGALGAGLRGVTTLPAGLVTGLAGFSSLIFKGFVASLTTAFAGFSLGQWIAENTKFDEGVEKVIDWIIPSESWGESFEVEAELKFQDTVNDAKRYIKAFENKTGIQIDTDNEIALSFVTSKGEEISATSKMLSDLGLNIENLSTNGSSYLEILSEVTDVSMQSMVQSVDGAFTILSNDIIGKKYTNGVNTAMLNTTNLANNVLGIYDKMVSGTGTALGKFVNNTISSNTKVNSSVKTLANDTTSTITQKYSNMANNVSATVLQTTGSIANQFTKLKTGTSSSLNSLSTVLSTNLANMTKKVNSTSWYTPGTNLVAGLKNGIVDKWKSTTGDGLVGKIVSLASGLTDSLKKAFGIHSPSRLWRDEIGYYLAEGLRLGVVGEETHITKDILDMGSRLTNTMSGALTLATPSSLSSNYDFGVTSTMAHNFSADGSMSSGIAQGVRDGVYSAQAEQNALLREQNNLLLQILNKEGISMDDVYSGVVNRNRDNINRTGLNPMMAY